MMSESTDQTPEWMLKLENKRKQPHRLAHEIGAGAPCLNCKDDCPGLDLHFWRKLCRNCKCKKEEHDIKDDEGHEQFEILLGAQKKTRKVLKIEVPEETKTPVIDTKKDVLFDWVPPNVSDDVAAEYMQKIPTSKLPISGSDGALYRRQQLEKQVPLHDLDASKCHNLSDQEVESLKQYLDNLKRNVVGQGRVCKVPLLYVEQRMPLGGASAQSSASQAIPYPLSAMSQPIRTSRSAPESLLPPDDDVPPPLPTSLPPGYRLEQPAQQGLAGSLEIQLLNKDVAHSSSLLPPGQPGSQSLLRGRIQGAGQRKTFVTYLNHDVAHSSTVPGQFHSNIPGKEGQLGHLQQGSVVSYPQGHNVAHSSTVPGQFHSNIPAKEGQPGHLQQGSVVSYPQGHDIAHSSTVPGQFHSNIPAKEGQPGHLQQGPMASYPYDAKFASPSKFPEPIYANQPFCPNQGGLMAGSQDPPVLTYSTQDYGMVPSDTVGSLPQEGTLTFSQQPQDVVSSTDVSRKLAPCVSKRLNATNLPNHPTTDGPLTDPGAGKHQVDFLVERDPNTGEALPLPLDGAACHSRHPSNLSFSSAVPTDCLPKAALVIQRPQDPHRELSAGIAQLSGLGGEAPDDRGCLLECVECRLNVIPGEVGVFADRASAGMVWHPQCFVCSTCKELLVDLIYFFNEGRVYCGRHFAELLDIPRCYACDELIFVKEYTMAEGKLFHVKHFCCFECDEPLGGKQYVIKSEQPVCLDCYQEKYGKMCVACQKPITAQQQRLGWKDLNWHVEGDCFTCHTCRKSLLGGKFAVRDLRPFCSKECIKAATG